MDVAKIIQNMDNHLIMITQSQRHVLLFFVLITDYSQETAVI